MQRLWPGWLLCVATAGLFAYMALGQVPAISALIGGMELPDLVPLGYDAEGARALFSAFAADFAASQVGGRQSASEAYLALHAGSDLVFPPLLAVSLGFCGFGALYTPHRQTGTPRPVSVGLGLVLTLAFVYLGCDFVENAVTDAMFGPRAVTLAFDSEMVFELQVLTRGKYLSLGLAFVLIARLWLWRWRSSRHAASATASD